jgi:hypothetical protein
LFGGKLWVGCGRGAGSKGREDSEPNAPHCS